MKKVYCVLCRKTHKGSAWKYKKWTENTEGWACEKWYKPRYLKIIPFRFRAQADNHRKEMLQPFLNEEQANPQFIKAYQNELNLREYFHDSELKKHLGPKYLKTHKPKERLKADRDDPKLEDEVVK
jgi:hypothetical protein